MSTNIYSHIDENKRQTVYIMLAFTAVISAVGYFAGQYFGEGIDISNLECLFIVYPFAFQGKLIQYIGRIQRSEKPPVIFDYRDSKIDYFENMFKQRNRYYKKLLK